MEISREKILAYINTSNYRPGKMKELARAMGVPQSRYRDFRRTVKKLVGEGLLVRGHHNRYLAPSAIKQVVGRLKIYRRGFGLVAQKEGVADVFIADRDLGEALDGDLVRVALTGSLSERGEPRGRIVEIVEKIPGKFVGTYQVRGRRHLISPDDVGINRDIYLNELPGTELREGYKAVVRIVERARGYDGLQGEVIEVLGDPEDPRLDFLTLVHRFGFLVDYCAEAEAEAKEAKIDLARELPQREDLRGSVCFSIDPDEARDFDDAVSIQRGDNGEYILGVHIADVSHFVVEGSALDRAARERGTSVYLLDRVIHMLPSRLSVEICTLAPGEDRLAISVLIKLDAEGQLLDYRLSKSVICSAGCFSYRQVQTLLDGGEDLGGSIEDFREDLKQMHVLATLRTQIRLQRGALDFDMDQPLVEIDTDSKPTALGSYPRWDSHRLIEEFMLLANECVADYALRREIPVLYRVHRPPSINSLRELANLASSIRVELDSKDELRPGDLQRFLAQVKGRKDSALINKFVLRAMNRAEYSNELMGHFGLASGAYLHFTSPIRRYPDLWVHRMIKEVLTGETPKRNSGQTDVQKLGQWTSARERRAEEAERMYIKTKQMRYMERHIGDQFPGQVSGVLRGGFFVEVGTFKVDGFCYLRDLDDYFELDQSRHRLVGRRSRRIFQPGTPVQVVIAGVNRDAGEMDLLLIEAEKSGKKTKRRKKR